jgi:hypothetical protein
MLPAREIRNSSQDGQRRACTVPAADCFAIDGGTTAILKFRRAAKANRQKTLLPVCL